MKLPGFIGPSYTLQSTNIEAQRTINLYPQMDESGTGRNVAALLSTPGLTSFATLDAVRSVRGLKATAAGRLFAVTYTTLWEVMADGTATDRGTLNSSAGFVGMEDNGRVLMVVDGPNAYQFNLTTAAFTGPLPSFMGGNGFASVAFQDGFFIYNQPLTQTFWITGAYSTVTDPTNFASAEASPDNLICLLSDHELLWLFGANSTEVWYDAGNQLFPFARVEGGVIQYGIVSAQTACRFAGSVIWLAKDENGRGLVLMATGLQPNRVSTHAIEQELATYATIADATAYTYQQDGHAFYVLNFPSGNATWVFDAITNLWHQRAYTNALGLLERQRSELHAEAFGKHIVSDWQTGKLYVLDRFALNDAGARITKLRAAPYVAKELNNVFFSKLTLDLEMGLGPDGQAFDIPAPQAMLQWSDDGGKTWSNEYWVGLGMIGQTLARAIWRRLGKARKRVFRVTVTDDCPLAITDAYIDVTLGAS